MMKIILKNYFDERNFEKNPYHIYYYTT